MLCLCMYLSAILVIFGNSASKLKKLMITCKYKNLFKTPPMNEDLYCKDKLNKGFSTA